MGKMQQDSRKAYEVTVKIHILTRIFSNGQANLATLSVQRGANPPL